ncbi:MAG: alkaline phosphatase family protein [Acidobacteriota bacterium]|nr:alkaline phosphatase family protein [Acidobacteriota bacterium]
MTHDPPTPARSSRSPRGDVISLALGALPGILLGAYATGLLLFINPELAQTPAVVLRGVALYGGLFGAASCLLSLLVAGPSAARARALLPWSLTFVLALTAVSTWWHASLFSYSLPPGINVRLIKAAVLLSVAALAAFLTALSHTLARRPYGRRSRILLAALSVAVLYVMVERRAAFDPPRSAAPLPSETSYRSRPDLWVIGIEGATLDAILPLAEQGELPFFARLLAQGASARLASLASVVEPALWTTVATGRHPYRHGVVGERVYPAGLLGPGRTLRLVPAAFRWWGFLGPPRPVDAEQRRSSALWEIFSRLDIPPGVVGWPATHPLRQPMAYAFSERYFDGVLREASARPSELAERGVLFRVAAEDLDPELVEPLGEPLSYPFLQALAADAWRESLALFMLDQRPEVDALFLRLEGLADVSRRYYGGFAAVHFDGAQDPKRQEAARLVAAYYRHLDRLLAALDARPGRGRVLAVVSASGWREPRGWRRLSALSRRGALRGSQAGGPDGMLLLSGPGVQAGLRLAKAELVDVLPTLLYSVDLPIARDFDGRVLTAAFESAFLARQPVTFVPSYETLALEEAPRPGPELMVAPTPSSGR